MERNWCTASKRGGKDEDVQKRAEMSLTTACELFDLGVLHKGIRAAEGYRWQARHLAFDVKELRGDLERSPKQVCVALRGALEELERLRPVVSRCDGGATCGGSERAEPGESNAEDTYCLIAIRGKSPCKHSQSNSWLLRSIQPVQTMRSVDVS